MNSFIVGLCVAVVFIVGHWLGRRARHETVVSYIDVDVRPKLAKLGRAFRGRRLSATTFDIGNDSETVGSAHDATYQLIALAEEAARCAK